MEQNQPSASRRDHRYRRKKQSEWPHILLFYVLPFIVFNSILFDLILYFWLFLNGD